MTFPSPYPGPIPPFNNVPINAEYFQPSQFFISAITLGTQTTVTTTVNHNYVVGQLVRLLIPQISAQLNPPMGPFYQIATCTQLNEQQGYVIEIPAPNQVVLNINSSTYNLFVSSSQAAQPQILAIGNINSGVINSSGNLNTGTFIPGTFQNISPL